MKSYYAATIQFCKILQFVHCDYHKFSFANHYMMFGGCTNFKYLVWCHNLGKCQNLGGNDENIMQSLYNFVKFWNLCIAITINLFFLISR